MHQGIIEHVIPGRLRLRFRAERRNADFFRQLARHLEQLPTVQGVVTNPLTGSVLIFHRGSSAEIATRANAGRRAPAVELLDRDRMVAHTRQFRRYMPQPATLAFCGLALYQLARGRVANSAAQQFWYAERAAALGQQSLALGMAALGLLQVFGGRWLAPASSFLMYALLAERAGKARKSAR
jgi:hypothetical protein